MAGGRRCRANEAGTPERSLSVKRSPADGRPVPRFRFLPLTQPGERAEEDKKLLPPVPCGLNPVTEQTLVPACYATAALRPAIFLHDAGNDRDGNVKAN